MKRKLLLSGFILGTVGLGIFSLILVIGLIQIFAILGGELASSGVGGALALTIFEVLIFIVAFVLNAVCINTWNNEEKFNKKKATIYTTIVFNFISIIFLFYTFFGGGTAESIVFSVIVFLCVVAANVLVLIDLTSSTNKQENVVADSNDTADSEISDTDKLEEKLKKLEALKNENKISEEEYNELKKKYIDEEIKNN